MSDEESVEAGLGEAAAVAGAKLRELGGSDGGVDAIIAATIAAAGESARAMGREARSVEVRLECLRHAVGALGPRDRPTPATVIDMAEALHAWVVAQPAGAET